MMCHGDGVMPGRHLQAEYMALEKIFHESVRLPTQIVPL